MKRKILFATIPLIFHLIISFNQLVLAQAGEWTWTKGDSAMNCWGCGGNFGSEGITDPAFYPDVFAFAFQWKDSQGNFWKFGGDASNKMWKYDVNLNEWSWMNGDSSLYYQTAAYGTLGLFSSTNNPGNRTSGASWIDSAGFLWLYGGDYFTNTNERSDMWKYDPSINQWAWIQGSQSYSLPVYGTQGVPAASNTPGSRTEMSGFWTDSIGNMWLFGGFSYSGWLSDVWKFDPGSNQWTWMGGSNLVNQAPDYGTFGISAPTNTPGGRSDAVHWTDSHGKFWIYGGYQNPTFNSPKVYDDLWMYDPLSNEWTWEGGVDTVNCRGNRGALCESSTQFLPCARLGMLFSSELDTGKRIWLYGGWNDSAQSSEDLWVYNTLTKKWAWVSCDSSVDQNPHFGLLGIASTISKPGSRSFGALWIDDANDVLIASGITPLSGDEGYPDIWIYKFDSLCIFTGTPTFITSFLSVSTEICEKFCTNFVDQSTNNPTAWQWIFPGGTPSSSTDQNPINICYNEPGVYDVTLITTNANGNDTLTLHNYITVYPTPAIPTITQNGYTLTSSPADFYQWQLNTVDIPGATNQSYTVTQTGFYTVVVSDSNGCNNSATQYVEITGIHEMSDGEISVYPNPSNGNFTVEFVNTNTLGEVSIDVTNAIGQKVFSEDLSGELNSEKKEIHLNHVAAGIYFVEIKSGNDFIRKKIFIVN